MSAPGLAWQACFKKREVKLELLTDIDTLLMDEKGIRGGISELPERLKIEKFIKLVSNVHNKKNYIVHLSFKTSTKSWINTKKSAQSNSI